MKDIIEPDKLRLLNRRNDDLQRTDETFVPLYQLQPYAPADSNKRRFVKSENPIHLNERLTAQQGVFLCPGNLKASFVDNLKAMPEWHLKTNALKLTLSLNEDEAVKFVTNLKNMNLSFAALFPGIDGFSKSLAQQIFHYHKLRRAGVRTGL